MDCVSMAAVTATRLPNQSQQGPIPPADLLVLHSAARLGLYVGSRHVCDISLKPPGADDGMFAIPVPPQADGSSWREVSNR